MEHEPKQVLSLHARQSLQDCAVCGGTGLVRYPDNQGNECEDPCPVCDGIGLLPAPEQPEAPR